MRSMSGFRHLLGRLRGTSLDELEALLRPTRIDELLYVMDTPPADRGEVPSLEIRYAHPGERSGMASIDVRLSRLKETRVGIFMLRKRRERDLRWPSDA
jgi:hypothetical protein